MEKKKKLFFLSRSPFRRKDNEESPNNYKGDHHQSKTNLGLTNIGVKINHSFSNNFSILNDIHSEKITPTKEPVKTQGLLALSKAINHPAPRSVKNEDKTRR